MPVCAVRALGRRRRMRREKKKDGGNGLGKLCRRLGKNQQILRSSSTILQCLLASDLLLIWCTFIIWIYIYTKRCNSLSVTYYMYHKCTEKNCLVNFTRYHCNSLRLPTLPFLQELFRQIRRFLKKNHMFLRKIRRFLRKIRRFPKKNYYST